MSILAIDAGTTEVKAFVVTRDGRLAASGHQGLRQHVTGPGWVEHAPEEIWQATLAATRACLDAWSGSPADLVGLGIANQRGTVLLWDRETLGSPRRAVVRQDRRTADLCRRMREEGLQERVGELTGQRLDTDASAPKLTWLAEEEPHTWALVEQGRYAVGTVDSYLTARMSRGTWHVTDVSNASSTLLFDLGSGDWSEELCERFGVPREALPELMPSWGEIARTDQRSFLGLDLPVAGLAGDRPSALFGQARFDAGESSCTYGNGTHVVTNTGAEVVRSGAGPVSTAVWRSPEGETTFALEGTVGGPEQTLETIAFEVRDVIATMPTELTSLRVGGSGAGDDRLCQLQADLLGVPVRRPEVLEASALGVAFMAGLGTGVWDSTEHLRGTWRLGREFTPDGSAGA